MAVSLNSVVGFNSKNLQARNQQQHLSRCYIQASSAINRNVFTSTPWRSESWRRKVESSCLSAAAAEKDQIALDSDDKGSPVLEQPVEEEDNRESQSSSNSSNGNGNGNGNGSVTTSTLLPRSQSTPARRSPLTARERLRAARVFSKHSEEAKAPSKSEMGSKVLDAIKESDRGKRRSRLPEAPTNLLDDSKRGMPKAGLTFQFPGGVDLLVIAFSFVFITTVMFATTYLVWKVGAIHFNEY